MTLILSGTDGLSDVDGSAATPAIRGTDANTGIFFPAADTIAFSEGGVEAMRIDSSGNVGIGTASPSQKLDVRGQGYFQSTSADAVVEVNSSGGSGRSYQIRSQAGGQFYIYDNTAGSARMTIDSSGNVLVAKTATDLTVAGAEVLPAGRLYLTASASDLMILNRLTNDGALVEFRQANTVEGTISVSGTTVSYNGGHLSRWAQTTSVKDNSLLKGTVLSNLDAMNVYTDDEGNPVPNEQLNKVKVSDVEGDINVAGVFVNWFYDEQHEVDEINMAMTGDMIIRISQGVTVVRGDLLISAGDGTAKPQGDDIRRSKTVAKVTSNHVTCTYEDGSYCVPCVLMAC